MSAVEVGQVWADNDWRSKGRTVEIEEVGETHAVVKVLTSVAGPAYGPPNGRRTRIRLDRFRPTSTGYRLVTRDGADGEAGEAVCCCESSPPEFGGNLPDRECPIHGDPS